MTCLALPLVRALLACVVVTSCVSSTLGQDLEPQAAPAPPAADPVVRLLVWAAADAPDDEFEAALAELGGVPRITWRDVHDVLEAGRTFDPDDRGVPASSDAEGHAAWFEEHPFEPGVVRTYPIGEAQPFWYGYTLPEAYDGKTPVPVWLELGGLQFGRWGTPVPDGWAVVEISPFIHGAATLGGQPIRWTAGVAAQSIVLSIVADLERHFRVDRDRLFTGGYSRFGNSSWYFGFHWPDRWAGVIPSAGYYPAARAVEGNVANLPLLVAYGADRGHRAANDFSKRFAGELRRGGLAPLALFAGETRALGAELEDAAWRWMQGRRREALPQRVSYTMHDPNHRGAYWAEIVEVRATGGVDVVSIRSLGSPEPERIQIHRRAATIEVEAPGENQLRVRLTNVKEARVYLSPRRFDLTEPVSVRVGSKGTRDRRVLPSIRKLLENFRRHRDDRRLFPEVLRIRDGKLL